MVEADLGRSPGAIEFIFGQSFYSRGHFCDTFKEFVILNNSELGHIKMRVKGSRPSVGQRVAGGVCTLLQRGYLKLLYIEQTERTDGSRVVLPNGHHSYCLCHLAQKFYGEKRDDLARKIYG